MSSQIALPLVENIPIPFVFSPTTQQVLALKVKAFHGIFTGAHLTAEYLEDVVASSLNIDPELHGFVEWKSNSHKPGADIILTKSGNVGISVKSGTITKNNILKLSGNRFTKANGDFNEINRLLNAYKADITVSFVFDRENRSYALYYVDKEVFESPESPIGWIPVMGKGTGRVTKYSFTAKNGVVSEIVEKMSAQIWWGIPLGLCRIGFVIPY